MRKSFLYLLIVAFLGIILVGVFYGCFWLESPDFTNYKRVQVEMSVEEVEAILGPGTPVNQAEVPRVVVAVSPEDAKAAREKARRSGGPPSTVRNYPTRLKPVVEGEHILKWVNGKTGERILVAFKDGKVCEKDYHDPNYL